MFPVIFPGLIVQLPAGNPLNTTLPVGVVHVGWVIIPTNGELGVVGCALIVVDVTEDPEVHPNEFVTVNV